MAFDQTPSPKLTPDQKAYRKHWLSQLRADGGDVFSYPELGLTLAVRPNGPNFVRVSVAYMADHEPKFRRKVGEYHAINRLMNGQSILMRGRGFNMQEFAEMLNYSI